jgi:hypothetical protein
VGRWRAVGSALIKEAICWPDVEPNDETSA